MHSRTPGRNGVTDMFYSEDPVTKQVVLTKLATPGSSPERPSGNGTRWRGYYIDANGHQRTKQHATKKMAEAWAAAEGNKVHSGTWADPKLGAVRFRDIAEDWWATKANRDETTKYGYRNMLDQIVLPEFGDRAIKDVKHAELQRFINALSEDDNQYRLKGDGGFSPSRVIQIHGVILGVMKYAARTDHIVKNPCEGIELPDKRRGRQRYLTHEQLQALASHMGRLEALTLLMGYCGLRESEAFALRRSALHGRRLEIFEAVTNVPKKGRVHKDTKTHRTRHVPIPEIVWEKMVIPLDPDALLFPSWRGGNIGPGEYRWSWDGAMKKIGLSGYTPHDLRHTCASLAISAGANVKALQNLLGHASAVMTLDQYGHLLSDDLEKVAVALNDAARKVQKS